MLSFWKSGQFYLLKWAFENVQLNFRKFRAFKNVQLNFLNNVELLNIFEFSQSRWAFENVQLHFLKQDELLKVLRASVYNQFDFSLICVFFFNLIVLYTKKNVIFEIFQLELLNLLKCLKFPCVVKVKTNSSTYVHTSYT